MIIKKLTALLITIALASSLFAPFSTFALTPPRFMYVNGVQGYLALLELASIYDEYEFVKLYEWIIAHDLSGFSQRNGGLPLEGAYERFAFKTINELLAIPITRAEFSSLAVALYEYAMGEITGRITFNDTNDTNVEKAAYIGITSGIGNNLFAPDAKLNREQAAVMLHRTFRLLDNHSLLLDLPIIDMPYLPSTFADYSQISSWAQNAVAWVYGMGIMRDTGNQMFSPKADYTRGQSIVAIMKIAQML